MKSPNILNPELNIKYVKDNADFWFNAAYDLDSGGYYSNISRDGVPFKITGKQGTYYRKSLVSQTRLAYSFSKAFMLTGDENYLNYAKHALDFLFTYGWDKANGGWFTFARRDGTIDHNYWDPNSYKWGFQQHYALLGIIANYEATNDPVVKSWVDKGINSLYTKMWDARYGYEGYYEMTSDIMWNNLSGKGFTGTVDGITTNGEMMYLITQEEQYKKRLFQLADIITDRLVPEMNNSNVKVLFPESYNTNWSIDWNSKKGSVGHFVKTAWCVLRAYLCDTTKTKYKNAAIKILDQTWNYNTNGVTIWDHVNGGPFNELDITTGAYWNNTGKYKDYWTVEQGFTGPMIGYYVTKNPVYLQMADESLKFYMDHFVDKLYGETFQTLDATGATVINATKGDDFKAGYHSNELGYYAYLYSNLYYLNKPASLYYMFKPQAQAQTIRVTPIPMEDGVLRIKSVTLNGAPFTNFDAVTRTLNIAANEGGKFKVTFEAMPIRSGVDKTLADKVILYPNPSKDIVKIQGLDGIKKVSVLDVTGKVVYSSSDKQPQLNVSHLRNGVYFVNITLENNTVVTKKLVKQD